MAFGDRVQNKDNFGNGTAPTATFTSSPTEGNLLVGLATAANAGTTWTATGWTFGTKVGAGTGGTTRGGCLFWKIAGAGESSTVTMGENHTNWELSLVEYTGPFTSTPLDVENNQTTASSNTHTTPTVSPTSGRNELLVGGILVRTTSATWSTQRVNTSSTGVVEDADYNGGANTSQTVLSKLISSTTGTYNADALSSGAANVGLAAIAMFRAATFSQTASEFYEDGAETTSTSLQTFYFDGSDASVTDPNAVWTSDANAFDGSTSTSAQVTTTGSVSTNYLMAEGTNAPSSGGTITSVKARLYGARAGSTAAGNAAIYTDSLGELLGTPTNGGSSAAWGVYTTLSTPSGGWTWAKVQALEVKIYGTTSVGFTSFDAYRVEVYVESDVVRAVDSDSNIQLRVRLQETSAFTHGATDDYRLQVSKNGGAYANVNTSEVTGYNSASLTDGNATTNRMGAGTGSFVAGEISEDGLVDDLSITASNYTELLYSLTLVSSALADADTLDFRVIRNGLATNITYTVTPRITVSKASAAVIVTQDIAISLTEDNTTITQDHVIATADIANALTSDNDTIAQDHVVATQDTAISLTEDNTTIIENFTVEVQDTAIALTSDNTTISQNHIFSPDDIAFALTQDNDTIAQNHIVVTQDVAIGLTEDNTTIAQDHIVVAQDVLTSLSEDNTTIDQTNFIITVQDVAISLTTDNDTINQNHVVLTDDIAFSLTQDNDTISQDHVVATADILVSLISDNTTIEETPSNVEILTDDVLVSTATDNTTTAQNHVFTPDDIVFSLTQDNDTISQNHVITSQDVLLSLTTDNATITQNHIVTTQDILSSLTEDATTITQNHIIADADITLSLTTDNTTVDESIILSTADIAHNLLLDNTTITQNHVFSPDDIAFALTQDNDAISQNHIVVTQDILHNLTADGATISQNHLIVTQDGLISITVDTGYAFDGTTQPSRSYYIDTSGDVYWVISQTIGLVEKV